MRPRATTEHQTQNAILIKYGTDPRLRLWRMNTGGARDFAGNFVRFGIKGQADLSGILPGGIRLEIEVKSPTGKQTKDQMNYQTMITRFQGVYVLARSVEDVDAALAPYLP